MEDEKIIQEIQYIKKMLKPDNLLYSKDIIKDITRLRRRLLKLIELVQQKYLSSQGYMHLLKRLSIAMYYVDIVYEMVLRNNSDEVRIFASSFLSIAQGHIKLAELELEEQMSKNTRNL